MLWLERSNDVVFVIRCNALRVIIVIIDDDRKGWPDPQMRLDRSSVCTANVEIEAMW